MIGIYDLLTVTILDRGFQFLSKNPHHIEFMLCGFNSNPLIADFVGKDYVKKAVQLISDTKIHVAPHFEYDIKRRPSIAVISSSHEDMIPIGEYGSTQILGPGNCAPTVYASFDLKKINGDEITVSKEYGLKDKIWHNIYIVPSDGEIYKCKGVLARDGEDTVVYLDRPVKEGTLLKGWAAKSGAIENGYEINSSIDNVTVQCKLTTVGDSSTHRLWSMALQYVLKSQRPIFDGFGLQLAQFSSTPMMLTDNEESEYESVYTIEGKFTNSWIAREFSLIDPAARIDICLAAWSSAPNTEEVILK